MFERWIDGILLKFDSLYKDGRKHNWSWEALTSDIEDSVDKSLREYNSRFGDFIAVIGDYLNYRYTKQRDGKIDAKEWQVKKWNAKKT